MADSVVVTLYVCTLLGFLVCVLRLALRKWRSQAFNSGDYLTMVTCVCIIIRLVFVHLITIWGTTNTLSSEARLANNLSDEEMQRRIIASQLTIANRILYNTL